MNRPNPAANRQRMLDALTGLRAFAAAWVVLYHFRADIKALAPTADWLWPLLDSGYAGVDVFFVLSGFIIAYTYLDRLSHPNAGQAGRFLWYRLARLYPVHLFTLAIFAVIVTPGSFRDAGLSQVVANITTDEFLRQLLMVHAWGTNGNIAWNYPAWSISSEWFAYLLFPFVALGLARLRRPLQACWGFVLSNVFNVATFAWIALAGMEGEIILVRIVGEFAAGCFLFLLWRQGWRFEAPWPLLTPLFALASAAVTIAVAQADSVAPVVAAPLYGGLIYGLAIERDILSRILATRLLVYAGEASYALYMVHAIVQRFTWEYLPSAEYVDDTRLVRLGVLFLYAALLALAAIATYEFIERPSRDWMRRVIARSPGPATEPVAVIGGEEPVRQRPAGRA